MAEEIQSSKPIDRITFAHADADKPLTTAYSRPFQRVGSVGKDEEPGVRRRRFNHSILGFRRQSTKDDAEAAYDEGFDPLRESDYRHKQVFHGWKLLL
jgi:hypothetical protein